MAKTPTFLQLRRRRVHPPPLQLNGGSVRCFAHISLLMRLVSPHKIPKTAAAGEKLQARVWRALALACRSELFILAIYAGYQSGS